MFNPETIVGEVCYAYLAVISKAVLVSAVHITQMLSYFNVSINETMLPHVWLWPMVHYSGSSIPKPIFLHGLSWEWTYLNLQISLSETWSTPAHSARMRTHAHAVPGCGHLTLHGARGAKFRSKPQQIVVEARWKFCRFGFHS